MTDIKEFKSIADGFMEDIQAGRELKQKTLERCMSRSRISINKMLAAAACLIVVAGFLQMSAKAPYLPAPAEQGSRELNIMAAPNDSVTSPDGILAAPGGSISPEGSDIGPASSESSSFGEWKPGAVSEAREAFGGAFLEPTDIPDGFRAGEIFASGKNREAADRIVLTYHAEGRSFVIMEEKIAEGNPEGFQHFKQIDINGSVGYVESETAGAPGAEEPRTGVPESGGNDGSGQYGNTEVHWFANGVHYTVVGPITESEAVETAVSMK